MVTCSVPGCNSSKKEKTQNYTFHIFPQNERVRQKWLNMLKRKDWVPRKYSKILNRIVCENMVRCSVLGCKSDSERKVPDLSFHSFPTNNNLLTPWVESTGRNNWTPKKSSKICSKHFQKNMLIKKDKLTILYPNAVPIRVSE
ncbi:jg12992 [Pararge aegeria aegeria]|uniref:Jg12992 protein n=1 Tax=Pararge aegeria aegeria TaxID=348720 RepID=A0A8S4QVN4_9NEOP|nr:jg12992 [Pararge aegeria aegeria]